ncbi:hypothetical protein ACEPPN_014319 [Leptodophora sp. 'Broadleaf-Isolate-01']
MALRWQEALRKAAVQNEEPPSVPISSMRFPEQILNNDNEIDPALSSAIQTHFHPATAPLQIPPPLRNDLETLEAEDKMVGIDQNGNVYQQDGSADLSTSDGIGQLPLDMFEAELTAFLQGEVPADIWGNWDWQ